MFGVRHLKHFAIFFVSLISSCSAFSPASETGSTTSTKKFPETRSEFLEWREQIWRSIVSEIEDNKKGPRLLIAALTAVWSKCDSCGIRLAEAYGDDSRFRREVSTADWVPKTAQLTPEDGIYGDQLLHKRLALSFAAHPNAVGYKRILDNLLSRRMGFEVFFAEEAARHCKFAQSIELGEPFGSGCTPGLAVLSHCGNSEATQRIVAAKSNNRCPPTSYLLALVDSKDVRDSACSIPYALRVLAEFYPDEARFCALSRLSEHQVLNELDAIEALGYVDDLPKDLGLRVVETLKERPRDWECLIAPAAILGKNVDKEMQELRELPIISGCMTDSLVSLARSSKREHWDLLLEMSQMQTSILARFTFYTIAKSAHDERLLADAVRSSFTSKNHSGLAHISPDDAEVLYLRFAKTANPDLVIETFKSYVNNKDDDKTRYLQASALMALSTLSEDPRVAEIMKDATNSPWVQSRMIGMISLWAHYENKL